MTRPRHLIALIALCLVVRGGVLRWTPDSLVDDPDAYRQLAENLVEHGTFGLGTVPSAYRPPLYPLLLTPAVATGDSARVAIGVLHLALGVAAVCLVYVLGLRWGLGRLAVLGAVLVACDPILLRQSTLVMTETPATLLAVVALLLLTAAAERPGGSRAAAAGAWLAAAALCRPTFLVFMAVASVVLPMFSEGWPRRLRVFGAFTLAATVVLAPWIARNHVQLGRPVVATTHGGYTFLLGNNPWFYDYLRGRHWGTAWDADAFKADWSARLARGGPRDELANDRLAYQEARRTIRREPGTFVCACAVRVGRLWALVPHQTDPGEGRARQWLRRGIGAWYLVEFLLAAVGLVMVCWPGGFRVQGSGFRTDGGRLAWSKSWLWGVLLAICFTAVHTFYWTNMRMRAPLIPVVALGAAAGAGWIVGWVNRRKSCS